MKSPEIFASADASTLHRILEERLQDLPTLPVVAARILHVAADPESALDDLLALIATDPGLTAKILRGANDPFYGRCRQVTTLPNAAAIVGFPAVRNLILSAPMRASLASRGAAAQAFDWNGYWRHGIAVAACARLLAGRKGLPVATVEAAGSAGLLHDIGKLFLGTCCPDLLAEVVLTAETYQLPMVEAEWRLMGTSHALLGQAIAERWRFPAALAAAIGSHHEPESCSNDPALCYLVHAANVLTQRQGIGSERARRFLHPDVDVWLDLTSVEREDLLAETAEELARAVARLDWSAATTTSTAGTTISPPTALQAATRAIGRARTVAAVGAALLGAADAIAPGGDSALFLWDDNSGRFTARGGSAALQEIGAGLLREPVETLGEDGPLVIPAPHAPAAEAAPLRLVPLICGPQRAGFLLLRLLSPDGPPPNATSVDGLAMLAAHAAAGIVRMQALRATIELLSAALDARTPGGAGHSRRVHDLATQCARHLGFSPERIETLQTAALLHDIGKIAVSERILGKPATLSDAEFAHVAAHAQWGAHLAGPGFHEAMPFVLCHHERWDGMGYPAGLRGAQIPVEAQILAICEAWDTMRTGHTYRAALPAAAARRELQNHRGTQFDPRVVAAFLAILPAPSEPGEAERRAAA